MVPVLQFPSLLGSCGGSKTDWLDVLLKNELPLFLVIVTDHTFGLSVVKDSVYYTHIFGRSLEQKRTYIKVRYRNFRVKSVIHNTLSRSKGLTRLETWVSYWMLVELSTFDKEVNLYLPLLLNSWSSRRHRRLCHILYVSYVFHNVLWKIHVSVFQFPGLFNQHFCFTTKFCSCNKCYWF